MTRPVPLVLLGVLAVATLTACGSQPGPTDPTGASVSSSPTSSPGDGEPSSSSSPSPFPTGSPSLPDDPALPSATRGGTTVTGVVTVDPEARCTTLTTQDPRRTYVLVGDVSGVASGDRVRVVGVAGDAATTCQSGPTFTVRSLTPLG